MDALLPRGVVHTCIQALPDDKSKMLRSPSSVNPEGSDVCRAVKKALLIGETHRLTIPSSGVGFLKPPTNVNTHDVAKSATERSCIPRRAPIISSYRIVNGDQFYPGASVCRKQTLSVQI